jgi:hypothetical protein
LHEWYNCQRSSSKIEKRRESGVALLLEMALVGLIALGFLWTNKSFKELCHIIIIVILCQFLEEFII